MELSKSKKLSLAVVYIAMAVFNVVAFVLPFRRGGGFWTGYGFTMLSMLIAGAIIFFVFDRKELKSKFYGVPLLSVVWFYFIIQLILGIAEMCLDFIPIPFQFGIAVNTIILGACLVGLIGVNLAQDEIERIDEKIKEKVFYIKSLQADVEGLADRAPDESAKKILKELAETIRYSDPMSSPQLAVLESKIETKAAVLADAVANANAEEIKALCNELQLLFAERNRKCKLLK